MRVAAVVCILLVCLVPSDSGAQDTLRVLRHAPADTASPANVITVTFDRPVAGLPDRTIPAERVLRIRPAIAGKTEWRDPVTIRFVPVEPLVPGTRLDVSVESSVRAIDGSRMVEPYRFSFSVPGPRLLASSFRFPYGPGDHLPPDGSIRLLYSAAVDSEFLARRASMALGPCARADRRLALRVVRSRHVDSSDPYYFHHAGGPDRDTVGDRFRRVAELVPESAPPADCTVRVTLPTTVDDSIHGREESFDVRTVPTFRIAGGGCDTANHCGMPWLKIVFSTPVRRDDVMRYVHLASGEKFELVETVDPGVSWQLKFPVKPRTKYEIRVDSAMRDGFGRPLAGGNTLIVTTGDYRPAIAVATGLLVVPRSGARTMPVRAVNVAKLRVLAYKIPEVARLRVLSSAGIYGTIDDLLRAVRPETTLVTIPGRVNDDTTISLAIPATAFSSGSPLVVLRLSIVEPRVREPPQDLQIWTISGRETSYTILQASDLAVHSKLGVAEGSAYVTGLADGRPRADATVSQIDSNGNVIAQGVSGLDGLATLGPSPGVPLPPRNEGPVNAPYLPVTHFVEVRLGDDRVTLPVVVRRIGFGDDNPLDVYRLGGRGDDAPRAAAAIFTDRDVYRPGEMLYLKAVVRRGMLGALTLPDSRDSVHIEVSGRPNSWDDPIVLRDTVVGLSEFGTFADSLTLRATLPLGAYTATVEVVSGRQARPLASQGFTVAEYRAPEFLAEVSTDSATHFSGDTITASVSARYLFGAPMGNARVRWDAIMRETGAWALRIPHAEDWIIGERTWWGPPGGRTERMVSGDTTLDANGRLTFRVPLAQVAAGREGEVEVSVAITDISRQTVTASTSATVRGTHLYVLARNVAKTNIWTARTPTRLEIRTVSVDGSDVAGVPVKATFARRRWTSEATAGGYAGHWAIDTLRTDSIVRRANAVEYVVTPDEAGYYDVMLTAPDGHGATAHTSFTVYVVGTVAERARFDPRGKFALPLVAERTELNVGDVARVHIDSPFDSADVWLAVEREGVITSRVIAVRRGDNPIEIPIEARHVPNVWVSAVLVARANAHVRPDSAIERLRAGYMELRVAVDPKRLTVAVSPERREYAPGDTAVMRVRVRGADGRGVRGEVALWAEDEGVLALSEFQTPDLVTSIYRHRGVNERLRSTLPMMITSDASLAVVLAHMLSLEMNSVVMTATAAANSKIETYASRSAPLARDVIRRQFRSTAFYLGRVITDADGNALARAQLPDNITTFRVMAVAVDTSDRFGSGDTTFVVTRPLVARSTLPRFVRPADTLTAGAVVNARDARPRDVEMETSADGIAILGATKARITLPAGKGAEGRFDFAVPPRESVRDTVVVRVGASDGVNADATETKLPVKPDFHVRAHAAIGAVRGNTEILMKLPAGIDPARSRVSLRVGTSPLTPMLAAYERLRAYPYYCTEQISSVGRALVAVWRATRAKDTVALGGNPLPRLQQLADEIVKRQRADGAIKFWDDWSWSTPWLSAYAGLFLLDAREIGVSVDSGVIRRIGGYLHAALDTKADTAGMNRYERQRNRLLLGQRVASADFLRRAGNPAIAAEEVLLAGARAMTWEDRLRLAEVLAMRADRRAAAAALVDTAWRGVTIAGRRVDLPDSAQAVRDFPSRIAPAARLLTATLKLRPDEPLVGGLIETVLQHGRAEGGWAWSTQDYASVVMALAALTDTSRAQAAVRVSGRTGVLVETADSSVRVPLTGLLENGQLRLQLRSNGRAYYSIQVDEVPLAPPTRPDIQGIVVERWYERYSDGTPITSIKEGELVRVRMRVTVPADRQFVAVEDPLPAGLEPVDLRMRTSGTLAPFVGTAPEERQQDGPVWQSWLYGSWEDGWWSPWEHKEIRDDRVVYFARMLWKGSYAASYVARATTSGSFVRPPAHAEEMYNPALQGRSDGGRFRVSP